MSRIVPNLRRTAAALGLVATGLGLVPSASAQSEGGLYIAGDGFTFEQAADRAIAQNPNGRRFFLLAVPPEARAMTTLAPEPLLAVRRRVTAANGVLLVCQRDIDEGTLDATTLALDVYAVRGWPPPGSDALPPGKRYFADENPANLPAANEALRRLRSTCTPEDPATRRSRRP